MIIYLFITCPISYIRILFFQVYVIITSAPGAFNCQALLAFTDEPFSICTMVYTFIFSLYFDCCYVNLYVILILLSVMKFHILSLHIYFYLYSCHNILLAYS